MTYVMIRYLPHDDIINVINYIELNVVDNRDDLEWYPQRTIVRFKTNRKLKRFENYMRKLGVNAEWEVHNKKERYIAQQYEGELHYQFLLALYPPEHIMEL